MATEHSSFPVKEPANASIPINYPCRGATCHRIPYVRIVLDVLTSGMLQRKRTMIESYSYHQCYAARIYLATALSLYLEGGSVVYNYGL